MKVLSKEELKVAEKTLRNYLPKSQQVYGFVFLLNRFQAQPLDVLVDCWPDFNVLFVGSIQQEEPDLYRSIGIFTRDEVSLKNILQTDILDWTQYHCLSFDFCHLETIKAIALQRGVPDTKLSCCHMMTLHDPAKLPNDRLSVQVSSLKESHVALVNSTWKFGKGKFSEPLIRNMIRNFPSCCVLDSDGQPVAWMLTYPYCAMGILYTMPEHRRKGYAKAVVSIMAKKLYIEGYPVYCFIEEENKLSYMLFASLGFTEDPTYRITWYSFNEALLNPQ